MSLSDDQQADIINGFNTTSRYLDDILSINSTLFDKTLIQIYSSELQLDKANTFDTKAAFLDMNFSISNDLVSTKIYDKHDSYDYETIRFPFETMRVLTLHPMEFIFVNLSDLLEHLVMLQTSTLAKCFTQKLLKQAYLYHKLRKRFS